ncbi:hypothetical protein TGAM01_v205364 [Trichoderma gamsii]|uniref:Uncharacterized protein n=1 Tax=Trichoderma gamsii TaxID=398673 RepID=A0A0W7VHU2_9HYPO|nr:hypothetical protein TGAM01_v205364 [Trichoderma gamsii]PNP39066.1 hypothetical protein TGAMA5MH_09294 [Trichoderma gamsii]PON25928.1 hypothetical protein TGAM01_v205364 [Trichoderma gamsii]
MAGLPPNYNFTNQYDTQLQASISQMQQHQQQQLQQQQQQQLQQPLFQHSQTQMQHIQHQQLQQQQTHQTHQQQQAQLIQQLHQEARDRRERIRSKPFPTTVTQSVRDRQARGKDVYRSSEDEKTDEEEDAHEEEARRHQRQHRERQPILRKGNRNSLESVPDDESDDGNGGRDTDNEADILRCCRAEDFETRQRRAFAASVLDRPEQLMMYAQSEHDSIAGQRHRFMTIMCGYEEDEYWSNVGHHRATRRAARERQANVRKAMNIDRRTA